MRVKPLLAVAAAAAIAVAAYQAGRQAPARAIPAPTVRAVVLDPYAAPLLAGYRLYRDAVLAKDSAALGALAFRNDDYLAYRAALALARDPALPAAERLRLFRRAAELRLDDALARSENRAFYLELASVAEEAGDTAAALEAFAEALPAADAIAGLRRLESDPYRLANTFFKARQNRRALEALAGRSAPSIEGPAYQRLGEPARALDAYQRWLVEQPGSLEARYGVAWSRFYLGELSAADALFAELPGESASYGRALIAERRGDLDAAVRLLGESGAPEHLWLATGWLEAADRNRQALDVYLRLAEGDSVYADDSAYRAAVLARRLGEEALLEQAEALVPEGSFFALQLGGAPLLPIADTLPRLELEVVQRAKELARVFDLEAAVGELAFALRDAEDEAEVVALAEALQAFGEFRQSQRAAQALVNAGSRELRTWRAAFPRAYPDAVVAEAASHGVEPELVWAVMKQESAFYPSAVSISDARGLMQVIPSTWEWLAELQKEAPGDPFDPAANIRYGTYYLRWLLDYHDGDLELVVPSYNRGQGYIRRLFEGPVVAGDKDELFREIDALETREYLQRVLVNYRTYRELYGGRISAELAMPAAPAAATPID